MISFNPKEMTLSFGIPKKLENYVRKSFQQKILVFLFIILSIVSVLCFLHYVSDGSGVLYNDARSRLDIGRRVVEGLKPGLAQLGSVWLPLPHILMVPTVWVDVFWHSGFSGAIQSMIAFVATGIVIYLYLKLIGADMISRLFGVLIFAANLNILYMQSVSMTELLLMATMTWGVYELAQWYKDGHVMQLVKAAFFIMLATLNRYDGWFLLGIATCLVAFRTFVKRGYKDMEGSLFLFCTLGGIGIALWLLWNLLIFNDPFYFAFGPFSAKVQQDQLEQAGVLITKHDLLMSLRVYIYSLMYNATPFVLVLSVLGGITMWMDKRVNQGIRWASIALLTPFLFNIFALYYGHSVLFIPDFSGSWFNVRYGLMLAPTFAIFTGYLFFRFVKLRAVILGLTIFVLSFMFISSDAVTIDDARVGSSGKNVSEVSGWIKENVQGKPGFILISAASHDAVIFSSGLPMKRFIHEGTDAYWKSATVSPDRWARWIIMRTNDMNDLTAKAMSKTEGFKMYTLVKSFPFADIYEIKPEYVGQLNFEANLIQR